MLTPFIEVPDMVGGGCTDATPDDLPAQIVGPTQALDLGILKANNAAMPTTGNVQATAFAALPGTVKVQGFVHGGLALKFFS